MTKTLFCIAFAGLLLLGNANAQEYTTGPADWFRQNGKPCPQIDEIDVRMRQLHPDMGNDAVVQGTINTFFTTYYSKECQPTGGAVQYTGQTVYKAIIDDYKNRHASAPAQFSLGGSWVGKETCPAGFLHGEQEGDVVLEIIPQSNGEFILSGRAGVTLERPELVVSHDKIQITAHHSYDTAVLTGAFTTASRIDGTVSQTTRPETCKWFIEKR